MDKAAICCVILKSCPKISDLSSTSHIRLNHPLRCRLLLSLFLNHKVLEAAEKGDVYSLDVALTRGGIPHATKVTLNPDILLLHIRYSYFMIGRYARIGFCVRSAEQVALTVDGILFAQ